MPPFVLHVVSVKSGLGHLSWNHDHFQLEFRAACLISKAGACSLLLRWYQLEQISWDCICCFSALISRTVSKMVCQQLNWVQNLWACTYFSSQENHFLSFLEIDYNMLPPPPQNKCQNPSFCTLKHIPKHLRRTSVLRRNTGEPT